MNREAGADMQFTLSPYDHEDPDLHHLGPAQEDDLGVVREVLQ